VTALNFFMPTIPRSSSFTKRLSRWVLFLAIAIAAVATRSIASSFEWKTATPEMMGLSSAKVEKLRNELAAHRTQAFLLIIDDHIVCEWYAPDFSANKLHYTASMAKAVVGGVAAAVAISDGRMSLDDTAAKYIPQWRDDPVKSQITLRQLGSHTSGLDDADDPNLNHKELTGWKGDFWKRLPPPRDPFTLSRDVVPVVFPPGTKRLYSNPGIAILGYATTVALKDAPEKDLRTLLRVRVMRPIGVSDDEWDVGYGQTFTVDGWPLVASWGGGGYTARASARVARLMLHEGNWQGRQLIAASAVRAVTEDSGTPGMGAIGWWSNNDGHVLAMPRDAYWGAGAEGQLALVIPSLKLIAVRNGGPLDPSMQNDAAADRYFFAPLMTALAKDAPAHAPYPPSASITQIVWAPRETILRRAPGGDNWPMTWGDDDAQYTAYGDGNGFEPFVPDKLSLGFAKIVGGAGDFTGTNLRTPTGEFTGDGHAGRKASGLLMVDGVLYVLTRNRNNAQLGWSRDHGATWTWADWRFETSFGCPTFLNYGRNYAGARDGFVYVYSSDNDSAYEPSDRMVLARVPKERITQRNAYEFFVALDASGRPLWSQDVLRRGAVFVNPGNCFRSGISYDAGLKRYLWCQILPHSTHPLGERFQGGFGIYDAPEPWGPWTTVYYTTDWDVGPGESSRFPTKWMSDDGRTVYLVFSGNDSFSVRKASLVTGNR